MTIDWFMPGLRQTTQQQPPQGRGQTPPPQIWRTRKRQRVAENTSTVLGDATTRSPPRLSGGIIIQEPQIQVGVSVVSFSQVAQVWQPKFQLNSKPLPANACLRVWDKGEGGRVAQSLAHGLLLLEDVHAFKEGTEEFMGRRFQWHTIAVIFHFFELFINPIL